MLYAGERLKLGNESLGNVKNCLRCVDNGTVGDDCSETPNSDSKFASAPRLPQNVPAILQTICDQGLTRFRLLATKAPIT